MDTYIRDFTIQSIDTLLIPNIHVCCNTLNNEPNSKDFKVMHMNIRSLSKNFDEFKVMLKALNNDFDCYILTETRQIEDITVFQMEGYYLIYNQAKYNQNDGIVILLKSSIKSKNLFVKIYSNTIIQLELEIDNKTYFISALYRNPVYTSQSLENFLGGLDNYLSSININFDYSLFLGDINIDILKNDNVANDYLNIFSSHGYISAINKPTRVFGNSMSCIDHIFIKQKIKYASNDKLVPIILQSHLTDHFTTILQIISPKKKYQRFCSKKRKNFS